jgi:GMP synthase (glutamine-hydrolysing)
MRLLVVEGNNRETWQHRQASGGVPYHQRFKAMLNILRPRAKVEVAFPADTDTLLPSKKELACFDGVLWTGSSLGVNDLTPDVQRQLTFAADVFTTGVPFYGSCWGLQIATVAAGGVVAPCAKGWEFGLSEPIELTAAGQVHPCFRGRKDSFQALAVHKDEVVKLPDQATVLARNSHSKVQALTIRYKKSTFFGVQYHPEFTVADLAFITRYLLKNLVAAGVFSSATAGEALALKMAEKQGLPQSIIDYRTHIQEVGYWLQNL